MIGFNPDSYRVSEDAGDTDLVVCVLSGELQTQVSILFFNSPDTAVGKLPLA